MSAVVVVGGGGGVTVDISSVVNALVGGVRDVAVVSVDRADVSCSSCCCCWWWWWL